jgi:hypothetical protein
MSAITLVFGSFLIVLFFIVGLFIGWSAREYMMNYQEGPKQIAYHPEFYNKNGELIDQEIVSVRFEPDYFDDVSDDDDGE